MKALIENTQELQKETIQRVEQESGPGGEATIADNRPVMAIECKLRSGMNSSDNSKNPIQRRSNKTGLPDKLKSGIENLSGYSMDDVKVHYNSSKPAQLQAHAYAQGTDIHLASGQEKHLPHEAWHIVQQKQGRVQPTLQLKSKVYINDNVGLEREADVMGNKALQLLTKRLDKTVLASQSPSNQIVQRQLKNSNDAGTFQDAAQIPNIANRAQLDGILSLENHNLDPSHFPRVVGYLWNTYGGNNQPDLNLVVIKQVFKDLLTQGNSTTQAQFKRYLKFYLDTQQEGLINQNSNTLILGKYVPQVRNNQQVDVGQWWFRGPGSYIQLAIANNNSMHFDLGRKWDELTNSRHHDVNEDDLFHIFNTHVLDFAVTNNLAIIFVDHPDENYDPQRPSALKKEWWYLQERHGYSSLFADGTGKYIAQP